MKQKLNLFVKVALVIFVVFSVITVMTLRSKLDDLRKQKTELEAEVEKYAEEVEKMRYDLSLPAEEYIEKYAREVLGYHKSGEIVFRNEGDN